MTYQPAETRLRRDASEEDTPSPGGWVGTALFVLSIALIAFLAGAYVMLAKIPPYKLLTNARDAANALYAKSTQYGDPYKTDLWYDARSDDKGVITYISKKALNGYTLYTSSHEASAFLIDMNGDEVHRWHVPPEKIWNRDDTAGSLGPFVYIRKSYMYPNGDLLAVYEGSGDTPWGLGLVKLDKDSNVIWSYLDERAHHDAEIGADGIIYALTHAMRHEPVEGQAGLETPLIEDFLVVLSPDGKVQKRISLLDTIAKSRFKWLLTGLSGRTARDPLHTNSVKEVGAEAGAAMNVAREGDLMISFRNIKLVGVVDPEEEKIVWGTTGSWSGQHDAEPLVNGNVLLFDNNGNFNGPSASRVIEFRPETMEIVWQYEGTEKDPLKSVLRSEALRLGNGNTLITESEAGRLLEVTPEGQVVWEYVNPVRGGEGNTKIPIVAWAKRYTPSEVDAPFRTAIERSNRK
ncbi:MAG: arylsulfotransferase family protein [Parvibaculum sp.]